MGKKECDRCGVPYPADRLRHLTIGLGPSPRGRPVLLQAYVCDACYGNATYNPSQRTQLEGDLLQVRERRRQGVTPPYLPG
ncbi:MAG: hypothetical protein HYY96_16165 [Candidatus Tectomicrobia bacterium]|nr:hypothetical protein [Candidatus Tectomicrobia bacterium]